MVYIFEGGSVVYDGSTLTDDEKLQAILTLDNLPEPEQRKGKVPILRVDKEKQEVYYEYVDVPPTELERIEALESAMLDILFRQGGDL
jgi:hypothetical protein